MVDGVFEAVPGVVDAEDAATSAGVIFHPASAIDAAAVAQVQATLRQRILRAFVGRGLLEKADVKDLLVYKHSGFLVDAGVRIEAHDRAALERLLRYCAGPPFAMDRLRKEGAELVYRCAKQHSEPTTDKRCTKVDELHLMPLELIERIAALVSPPRTHRHRNFGVLAPNSPLRRRAMRFQLRPNPRHPSAHRRNAEGTQIVKILEHIGVDSQPPHIAPARGPPLREDCDAQMGEGVRIEPDWDLAAQPAPDYEVDQRVNWRMGEAAVLARRGVDLR